MRVASAGVTMRLGYQDGRECDATLDGLLTHLSGLVGRSDGVARIRGGM